VFLANTRASLRRSQQQFSFIMPRILKISINPPATLRVAIPPFQGGEEGFVFNF